MLLRQKLHFFYDFRNFQTFVVQQLKIRSKVYQICIGKLDRFYLYESFWLFIGFIRPRYELICLYHCLLSQDRDQLCHVSCHVSDHHWTLPILCDYWHRLQNFFLRLFLKQFQVSLCLWKFKFGCAQLQRLLVKLLLKQLDLRILTTQLLMQKFERVIRLLSHRLKLTDQRLNLSFGWMTLVDVAILGFEGDLLTSSCELKRGKCFVIVAGAGANCAHYRDFCLVV